MVPVGENSSEDTDIEIVNYEGLAHNVSFEPRILMGKGEREVEEFCCRLYIGFIRSDWFSNCHKSFPLLLVRFEVH